MTNILIPEDIPSHNKGEAALFYGLRESLRPFGDITITLFSLYPDLDRINYAGEATVVDSNGVTPAHMLDGQGSRTTKLWGYLSFVLKHVFFGLSYKVIGARAAGLMSGPAWKAYVDADLVLMSHDSFYSPLYHGTQALLFRLMGKPAIIYAATVRRKNTDKTSLKTRLLDRWVAHTSKRLGSITLREELSKAYLTAIGVTADHVPVSVFPDLAFIAPTIGKEEAWALLQSEGVPENQPLVGMAVSQRKLDFAFPGQVLENRRERALAPIVAATNYVTGTLGATVVFIPHSIGPSPILDDRITAGMIRDRALHPEKIIIVRNEYSSRELKGMAACLDMTIGTRLHFTIDAVCAAVPSLLISHDGDFRCHGIIGSMLGMQEYVYNIDAIDADTLIATIAALWQHRQEVRAHLASRIDGIKNDTYRHGETAMRLLEKNAAR
ncbi:polysaccharide pyruvyl transferase family protein [Desulfobulbus elongatus]|uniref:polysaccharide pyruvyl transferase family protein n=1 Tax=Desulfobulbus elongatus TaxID=53332 RepID=UPI000485E02F|nr:polysaccharide pyruvyl transferase family protein [Desulfobulbus elongatus]